MKFSWKLIKNLKLRNFPQKQYPQSECGESWEYNFRKFIFNWAGYNRYGLYTHDLIYYNDPVVRAALRRLPKDVLDARNFRIIRALQLSFLRRYLPREKWVTYEQDIKYRYLSLYMKEIEAEQAEINEFEYHNYGDSD
ncbi:cytochrome b-c1 complex subunit 7-like [Monomorium pharaonis]|uniref:cytochrome b-c1 complex subunit 7-like n=1 Tax=Monomorium pharaonis TaxID=307658 RepID=UPI001746AD42|nr:cytochrome b-c1 complex subunit 7-like [Monomorium pharaonis]